MRAGVIAGTRRRFDNLSAAVDCREGPTLGETTYAHDFFELCADCGVARDLKVSRHEDLDARQPARRLRAYAAG
jgi:hypothetical protein